MGTSWHNDQRPYQLQRSPSFVRIVDRQVNLLQNRFTFEYAGAGTVEELSAAEDHALRSAAVQGFTAFAQVALASLTAWPALSAQQRQDAWDLFRGVDVARWVEIHQTAPSYHSRGPDITASQDFALSGAASQGQAVFETIAATTLSPWWGTVSPADRAAFYENFKET